MSVGSAVALRLPRVARTGRGVVDGIERIGGQAQFYAKTVVSIGDAVTRYTAELIRLIAQMSLGTGALVMIGGTTAIVGFLTLSTGALVAVQGYNQFSQVGVEALIGFASAYFNVRLIAPLTAGIAMAATIGAGATAQIGAMRISEEIDALEVMGIKSISYLVSTRLMAGAIVIVPLYAMAILLSFLSAQLVTTVFYSQSVGTYEHYFHTFLRVDDVMWSFLEVIIMSIIIMLNHCYFGYCASGGAVGVGEAVGRSMRTSLIAIVLVVLLASLALYGTDPNFNLTV
jgi:phospholipid/cholesterol/gamma-HCH transport system permease protein